MKVCVGDPPSGSETRKKLVAAAKAVGIQTCSRMESGVTHYATSFPYSTKAQLARQSGATVVSFNLFATMIRERAQEPNKQAPDRYRAPTQVRAAIAVIQVGTRPAVQPVATPAQPEGPKTAHGSPMAPGKKRAIDLD
jgi:hypothetical protein